MFYGYFDGASRGNPGNAAAGAMIVDVQGNVVWELSQYLGVRTNNEAEYSAVMALLEEVKRRKEIGEITVYGDSQLVINQLNGKWKVRDPGLLEYFTETKKLLQKLRGRKVALVWVPRKKNLADRLANVALDRDAPAPEGFGPARLKKTGPHLFLAYGSECYLVDLLKRECTCPSFRFRRRCKHLEAAEKLEGWAEKPKAGRVG